MRSSGCIRALVGRVEPAELDLERAFLARQGENCTYAQLRGRRGSERIARGERRGPALCLILAATEWPARRPYGRGVSPVPSAPPGSIRSAIAVALRAPDRTPPPPSVAAKLDSISSTSSKTVAEEPAPSGGEPHRRGASILLGRAQGHIAAPLDLPQQLAGRLARDASARGKHPDPGAIGVQVR